MNIITNYYRTCLGCGKTIFYKSYGGWHNANRKKSMCRNCSYWNSAHRLSNLDVLLNDNPISFYWMGFLMADGHFSDTRLTLGLSIKDKKHLCKFGEYISYQGTYSLSNNVGSICCMNANVIRKINNKFDLNKTKTYHPPNSILNFEKDLVFSLIIGIIDGDGSITNQYNRKDCILRIKMHKSWLKILKEINSIISPNKKCCSITGDGYAILSISNNTVLRKIKQQCIKLNLPILNRKWDKINLNVQSRYEIANKDKEDVLMLYTKNLTVKEICRQLNLKEGKVYKIIRNEKNK